ncbi:MAG: rhodanese-like domain-containing protein [Candidatus Magnetomorum sp.]|nr:rhodanese-like domain-containing protein [Candidatus Magnetomorum sp.]
MFKSGIIKEIIYIVLLSMTISLVVNAFHPDGLKWYIPYSPDSSAIKQTSNNGPMPIDVNQAANFHNDPGYVFVDARSEADYRACHIENAVSFPEHSFEQCLDDFMRQNDGQKSLITYCSSSDCPLAAHLAEKLFFLGFENVYHLVGGLDAWQEKGLPVEGSPINLQE